MLLPCDHVTKLKESLKSSTVKIGVFPKRRWGVALAPGQPVTCMERDRHPCWFFWFFIFFLFTFPLFYFLFHPLKKASNEVIEAKQNIILENLPTNRQNQNL